MLKEKSPFVLINTLLLHIPLLALTDRQTDIQTDRETNTPAASGLEECFSAILGRKVSQAHSCSACVLQEFGWKYT